MCGDGVYVDRGQSAVLFLRRSGNRYYALWDGCAVRSLPIVSGKAVLTDFALPVDNLATHLGLVRPPERRNPLWEPLSLYAVLSVASAGIGFAIARRLR